MVQAAKNEIAWDNGTAPSPNSFVLIRIFPGSVGQDERIGIAEAVVEHEARKQKPARVTAALAEFGALSGKQRRTGDMIKRARRAAA